MAELLEKRKPVVSSGHRRRGRATQQPRKSCQSRVRLEQVLGLTASCSSLSSSGLVAYPAGCVVVLLNPKTNKQSHIINSSRKPFSALSFSHNGKLLVTGESGHLPCVRVWEVDGTLKAEVQSHKYGVSCVSFSTNDRFIVSVGFQHDMTVSVWDWKKGAVVASNKVSSRVCSISFSDNGLYFVTAGTRHLRFWYLQESAQSRVNCTVPLIGRSALLGEHKEEVFVAVACGRGVMADSTFSITSSGLLCVFNARRTLDAWVHLKSAGAFSLSVSEQWLFCGCCNGVVRVFSPSLNYITTLRRPHRLGVELQHSPLSPDGPEAQYPDCVALVFDPRCGLLTCVYSDHSLYSWDLKDLKSSRQVYSALYHNSCVWSLQVYPDLNQSESCLPFAAFLSSSSDNTIRVWSTESAPNNCYSQDLLRIVYVGENSPGLQPDSDQSGLDPDCKPGLRVLAISPDGAHLATGDRHGNLNVLGLEFWDELLKIEAHDSEVLCLEFSPLSSGVQLLASASRDRLIHIFNRDQDYSLIQTLSDHSGSITSVRFTGQSPELKLVSCGADKSIYIQTADQTEAGLFFSRSHHMVEKTSLYDMDMDPTQTSAAFACQDRNIRVYSLDSGKLMKTLKGSSSDEGSLLKVHLDPTGSFVATSCSDKNICIFDFESGKCVATLFGHSEIVTSIQFSQDCRHLITASGDSCIFVWRLDSNMVAVMRRKLKQNGARSRKLDIRRGTFSVPSTLTFLLPEPEETPLHTPGRNQEKSEIPLLQTNGKLPMWLRKLLKSDQFRGMTPQGGGGASSSVIQSEDAPQVRRRWAVQMEPIKICSRFSPSPAQDQDLNHDPNSEENEFCPQSLESLLLDHEEAEPPGAVCRSFGTFVDNSCSSDRDFHVQGQVDPVSASNRSTESPDQDPDPDPERFDTDLKTLLPPHQSHFLNPRLSLSTRFLSRYKDRIWSKASAPVPCRILEDSTVENLQDQTQTEPKLSKDPWSKPGPEGSSVTELNRDQALWDCGKENRDPDLNQDPGPIQDPDHDLVRDLKPAQARLQTEPGPDPETQTEPGSDPETQTEPGSDPETQTEPGPDPETQTEPGPDPETQTEPGPDPAPECDRPRPSPGEEEMSLEQVQEVSDRLQRTAQEATHLYSQIQSIPELACVLHEAFESLRLTLNSLQRPLPPA